MTEDHHDPDYVLGAVLAQVEDLDLDEQLRVLADAVSIVIAELRQTR